MKQPPSLSRRGDFRRLLHNGTRIRSVAGTVMVASRADVDSPGHLGVAVPGRVAGAVGRNRIKRRLRAAFRAAGPTGVDVLVRAEATAKTTPFQELEEMFRRLSVTR